MAKVKAVNVLENKKHRLVFEMVGEDHTLANLLREELWNDSDVKVSAYNMEHPLKANPRFIVETKQEEAIAAVEKAIQRIKRKNSNLANALKSLNK